MNTLDKAIRACDRSGIHEIEYLDIDGNRVKEKIKGEASKVDARATELRKHGCTIIKTKMFMNWS